MSYYEKHKEERKEIYRQRSLQYYYNNLEKRREYNKQYWRDNYLTLYQKRLEKKECGNKKIEDYKLYFFEKNKYENKTNIQDVYNLCLKKDNKSFNKQNMIISCHFN